MIDIESAIDRLKSTQSSSVDGITASITKIAKPAISEILVFIFNLGIKEKTYPDIWKQAAVMPLFKSGDASVCGNYGLISVLPNLGKLLERVIHNQCLSYLTQYDLLSDAQSGFREGHSTGTCLIDFLNEIYEEVDAGVLVGCSSWTWLKHLILWTMKFCLRN